MTSGAFACPAWRCPVDFDELCDDIDFIAE
jgi:hypothetical protein